MKSNISKYASGIKFKVGDISPTNRIILSYDNDRKHGKKYEIKCLFCNKIVFGASETFYSRCRCKWNEHNREKYRKLMEKKVDSVSATNRKIVSYDIDGSHGKKYLIECLKCGDKSWGGVAKFSAPCKKCSYEKKTPKKQGEEFIYEKYLYNAAMRAIQFDLTIDDFKNLIKMSCYYCGDLPQNKWKMNRKNNNYVIYNGIDRLDNSIGYTNKNCVACCKKCNMAKGTMSFNEFLEQMKKWADRIQGGLQ